MKDLVKFNNQKLVAKKIGDDVFVAIKPICDALGIDSEAQRQRILKDEILQISTCVIKVQIGDQTYEHLAINLNYLNGWLFGINTKRIKNQEVKEKVLLYKRECYEVLKNHFLKKSKPVLNNSIVRLQGILVRKDFTDKVEKVREKLKEQGSVNRVKFIHSQLTDLTYKLALGSSAKELRVQLSLNTGDNVKARLNDDDQRKVQVAEQFIGYLIDLSDYDYNRLKSQINVMPQLKAAKHKEIAA